MLVQKLRLQRGWSQEQLAELSGLSVRTIQRLERGNPASVESLKALGAVFEIDFSKLKEPEMSTTDTPRVSPDEALALAQVRRVKGFYVHVVQYCVTIAVLCAANFIFSRSYFWAGWVALAWGLGLLVHGLKVFRENPVPERDMGATGGRALSRTKAIKDYSNAALRHRVLSRVADERSRQACPRPRH